MECKDPKAAKALNKELKAQYNKKQDPERDIPCLRIAICVKYLQCPEFRNFLLTHPDKPLVEYAWWKDYIYGCVDVDENFKYNLKVGQVTGKNVCGRLINEIRREGRKGEEVIKALIDKNLKTLGIETE